VISAIAFPAYSVIKNAMSISFTMNPFLVDYFYLDLT
jgi:hypothetical protein